MRCLTSAGATDYKMAFINSFIANPLQGKWLFLVISAPLQMASCSWPHSGQEPVTSWLQQSPQSPWQLYQEILSIIAIWQNRKAIAMQVIMVLQSSSCFTTDGSILNWLPIIPKQSDSLFSLSFWQKNLSPDKVASLFLTRWGLKCAEYFFQCQMLDVVWMFDENCTIAYSKICPPRSIFYKIFCPSLNVLMSVWLFMLK